MLTCCYYHVCQQGPRKKEGWEGIVNVTYAVSTVIMVVGLAYAPTTSIKAWARFVEQAVPSWDSQLTIQRGFVYHRDEAIARNKQKEADEEIEWGKQYGSAFGTWKYEKAEVGAMPTLDPESAPN